MNIGLSIGLWALNYAPATAAAYDPTLDSWDGLWLASYSGAPWVSTASAGGSSGKNLTALDTAASVGAAQNGLTPANFAAGSSNSMTGAAVSNFIAAATGSIVAIFYAPSAAAHSSVFNDPAIVCDSGSNLEMSFSVSGVGFGIHDTAQKSFTVPCGTASYHAAQMRWSAGLLEGRVDRGAFSSVAAANISGVAGTLILGKQPGVAFTNMRLLALMMSKTTRTDAQLNQILDWANSQYGLAL